MFYNYNNVSSYGGMGAISKLDELLKKSKSYAVITSSGFKKRRWDNFFDNPELVIDEISSNPTVNELYHHFKTLKNLDCDTLIAIGGGSVIDATKVFSVMSGVSKDDFFLYLNDKKKCNKKLFKVIVIPTTSGTGAEVTPFATVWDEQNKRKMSLSSPFLYPDYAIVDPALTLTLNLRTTAITALDALSHSFESLWNVNSNAYTDALSTSNIVTILDNLPNLLHDLSNLDLRNKLSCSSYIAGICISITKTALAHSISYPLTSHLKVPHGLASGIFLPEILKFNNKHDKSGGMTKISNILVSGVAVEKKLNDLFSELYRLGIFDEILKHKPNIYSLIPEMENPSRSKNNIVQINSSKLKFIIDSFYEKY